MCDGEPARDCETINLTDYDAKLTKQLTKLDEQFDAINQELGAKKEAFVEMYRKDPRISYDEDIMGLYRKIQDFGPFNPQELTEQVGDIIEESTKNATLAVNESSENNKKRNVVVCQSFSKDNYLVDVSTCRRIVMFTNDTAKQGSGYCFLNHIKIKNDQVLQWTIRVPRFHWDSDIGMVISNE